jgi:hypothetical protein
MKNRLGVDWEIELPKQILEYIFRCHGIILSRFQENVIRGMVKNAFKQDKDR